MSSSCNSASSSRVFKTKGSRRGVVPPSPVSVLNTLTRFNKRSPPGGQDSNSNLFSSTESYSIDEGAYSSFSRSSTFSSQYDSSSNLKSIDESEDLVPVYSRQSSSRSLGCASEDSFASVDWLNSYATSILVPDSKDSSPIKEATESPCPFTGGFSAAPQHYPRHSRKQLAYQLDELIHSADKKIRSAIEEKRMATTTTTQKETPAPAFSYSPGESISEELEEEVEGFETDGFVDHDHDTSESGDEFADELPRAKTLCQSMEDLWMYGGG